MLDNVVIVFLNPQPTIDAFIGVTNAIDTHLSQQHAGLQNVLRT